MSTIAERVAGFTSGLQADALPADVLEKIRVTLLHNLAVALADDVVTGVSFRYAEALGAGSGARLFRTGAAAAPDTAAFVNATMIHARAQDDVYFPGLTHVGATLVPAVLALGEELDASGADLVAALAAGYETAGALSQGFAPRTTPRGFRATGVYGVLGAAAGAARLLGLDTATTADALGIATSLAGGTNQTWVAGSQEWLFQVGFCARNGLLAARLAAAGGAGAPDAFEGAQGFYRALLGEETDLSTVATDLGETWRVRDVTYKPLPVCAILQSPVTDALSLRAEHTLTPELVGAARLSLSPGEAAYPGTDSVGPFRGAGDALMSAQFCLAVALEKGTVTASDLLRTDDAGLLELARRIAVVPDPALASRSFRLEIDLRDGGRVEHVGEDGAADFNWDREGLLAQIAAMSAEMPPDEVVAGLVDTVLDVENRSVRDVVSAMVTS
ncbi:MmgE/PrpD family protein [Pseudonocardia dioxanivorans CB1190]|uniref:MmgE/PrpD family protein n=1 Tax=Pseudonocardia dioxanivorans (strain ATCC 55486 / DSM 44775 / JCM 13855 / CB1190) TaxID=675635 RepID=F4CZ05_PSEUX|nr:MmgE/PrpD family protein [Pseudonocardia dioxanivorans]AEA24296.1 MmgE/PrpD family protein [Pseudonocardia dioxanivorans CB1190]